MYIKKTGKKKRPATGLREITSVANNRRFTIVTIHSLSFNGIMG